MLTYIVIGAAILLLTVTCYLVGYVRMQGLLLDQIREENYELVLDNGSLREKVAGYETSVTMLLDEERRAS